MVTTYLTIHIHFCMHKLHLLRWVLSLCEQGRSSVLKVTSANVFLMLGVFCVYVSKTWFLMILKDPLQAKAGFSWLLSKSCETTWGQEHHVSQKHRCFIIFCQDPGLSESLPSWSGPLGNTASLHGGQHSGGLSKRLQFPGTHLAPYRLPKVVTAEEQF